MPKFLLATPLLLLLLPVVLAAQSPQHIGTDPVDANALMWDAAGGTLYAATTTGLARSNDRGVHWQLLPLQLGAEESIDAVAGRGDTLLVATSTSDEYTLQRSTDGGQNWEGVQIYGINRYGVRSVGIADGMLWIIDKSLNVRVSRNSGATWEPLIPEESELSVNAIAVQGEEIVAGTEQGLYRSTDRGATWTQGAGGITESVTEIALDGRGLVAAGTADAADSLRSVVRLYRMSDRGNNLAETIPFPDIENVNRTYTHSLAVADGALLVGVFRNYHHLVGETRLMRTADNGAHWSACSGIDSLGRLASLNAGGTLVVADGMHLLLSRDNGATFEPTGTELAGTGIKRIVGTDPVVASGNYLYRYGSSSSARIEYASWTSPPYRLLAARGNTLLASTSNPMESYGPSILLRSTDNGGTWSEVEKGLQVPSPFHTDNRKITVPIETVVDDGTQLVALSVMGLYVSTDNGDSWRGVDTRTWKKLTEDVGEYNDVAVLGDRVVVATELGLVGGSLKKGGWKWLKSWPKERGVKFVAAAGTTLYAATTDTLSISTDGGTTWRVKQEMSGNTIAGLAALGQTAAIIVDGNVALSRNGGVLWDLVELPEGVAAQSLHLTADALWVGSVRNGTWRVPLR